MANDNRYRKKGRRGKPPWSDLPTELVELVLQSCNFSDQARLRAVCRRWQSIPRVHPLKQQLPWLMSYHHLDWSECKLFDLNEKKIYTVDVSTMKEYYHKHSPVLIRIRASKSGWLLLSHFVPQSSTTLLSRFVPQSLTSAFLLYSPFTNRMIQLPNLKTSFWETATFSADPTSADCVFFVLDNSVHADAAEVSTCRLGDTTWTTHVFPGRFHSIHNVQNVVYSQGLFWCTTARGRLATFSVAQGIWNVLKSPDPLLFEGEKTYLVESNGSLLILLISHIRMSRHVFKLDCSQMAWILVEDIGDDTLFLGPTSLSVSKVAAKLRVSGKIHYTLGSLCGFLSGSTKSSYAYTIRYDLLAMEKTYLHNFKLWIEPPS